jgi:hypothetical protein
VLLDPAASDTTDALPPPGSAAGALALLSLLLLLLVLVVLSAAEVAPDLSTIAGLLEIKGDRFRVELQLHGLLDQHSFAQDNPTSLRDDTSTQESHRRRGKGARKHST